MTGSNDASAGNTACDATKSGTNDKVVDHFVPCGKISLF